MKNFSNNYWQNIYESKLSEEREGQNEMKPMITTVINVYMKSVSWGRLGVFIFCQFFTYSSFNDQKIPHYATIHQFFKLGILRGLVMSEV